MSTANLGRKITALLKHKGWSQSELSRRAGIAQPTISGIINNGNDPKLSTVIAIAAAFEVEITELIEDDETESESAAA